MTPIIACCACGEVELEATGRPISRVICFCDDCQAGGRQIEALPNAARILDLAGGTDFLAYRKDRVRITKGAERLRAYKIRPRSATRRMVAVCCHTAVILAFDDSKHWVDVFSARVAGGAPPLEMLICTRYLKSAAIDTSVPAFPGYPLRLMAKLAAAGIAMALVRRQLLFPPRCLT